MRLFQRGGFDYIGHMHDQWRTHDWDIHAGEATADPDEAEWLLTNGTGGYAMGTVSGCNTRRYHGLFVASTRPPVGRVVALNQVLEELVLGTGRNRQVLQWTTCRFRQGDGASLVRPDGHRALRRFEKGLTVRWTYRHESAPGPLEFTRELILHWKSQAVTLRYGWRGLAGDGPLQGGLLRLSPMLTLRDFHALLHKDQAGDFAVQRSSGAAIRVGRGPVAIALVCAGAAFEAVDDGSDAWWYGVQYPQETRRGQEDQEDYYVPGRLEIALDGAGSVDLTIQLEGHSGQAVPTTPSRGEHLDAVWSRLDTGQDQFGGGLVQRALVIAADDFIVERRFRGSTLQTIIAGYPWFADWGRDTFIALPGLMLATGRFDEARSTLRVFAQAIQDGLVPNRFDDYDESVAHYNAVDASLWFVHAAMEYVRISGDAQAWDQWLADAAIQVLEAFLRGTVSDIRMVGDGLVKAGSPATQLTWMDAACDGVVFTPRHGKAVEINALWYNALVGVAKLVTDDRGATAEHYNKLAKRVKRSFGKVFWDDELGYLRDHVWTDEAGCEQADRTLRPNQIIAVSLPRSPLPVTKQRQVLAVVRDRLLTPYGLRTLPVDDPHYHGRYEGDAYHRDEAYHQGTVWPWLIGPYAEAVLRVGRFSDAARVQARAAIKPLLDRLAGRGLGQLHEIHEGDPPHRPVGCMAQAWSVAEVLRVLRLLEQ